MPPYPGAVSQLRRVYTPQLSSQASLPVLGTSYPALKKKAPANGAFSEIGGPILIDKEESEPAVIS
jgi:hypothetical protein